MPAALPRNQARLLDGPSRLRQSPNSQYLLQLEPDRLLHHFRISAGLVDVSHLANQPFRMYSHNLRRRLSMRLMTAALVCVIFAMATMASRASAAEWQWAVNVLNLPTAKPTEHPRAFLWVPPTCRHIRAVVFGQHNMEEQPILEHPAFRAALTELGFAEVWVAPGFDANFRFDQGAGDRFDAMMKMLADESGYAELATTPVVPIGHSAAASMPEYFAAWEPERTLAYLSISGQWPYVPFKDAPQADGRSIDGVPGLVTIGEYEWADQRAVDGLKIFAAHPKSPFSFLACPADGHFECTDEKVDFLCFYLKKVAHYRLPSDGGKLIPIDPTTSGWLVERWHQGKDPTAAAAPVGKYTGDPGQAFWCFDEETAHAIESFQATHRGKTALLGYVQDGKIDPQNPKLHTQVQLKWEPGEDGITFKLGTAFLTTVPAGRPTKWTGQTEGSAIEPPPTGGPPIEIRLITGPIKQLSPDTFAFDLNRVSLLGDRRGNEAIFVEIWPGDNTFKRMVQQAWLPSPSKNTAGIRQKITFAELPNIDTKTGELKLRAASDANMPVHYFIESGPAEIDGDTLKLLPIPIGAKYPVKVTVVAWQWGRSMQPKVQTADPVIRTFEITR
jgi:hypothetical protein